MLCVGVLKHARPLLCSAGISLLNKLGTRCLTDCGHSPVLGDLYCLDPSRLQRNGVAVLLSKIHLDGAETYRTDKTHETPLLTPIRLLVLSEISTLLDSIWASSASVSHSDFISGDHPTTHTH